MQIEDLCEACTIESNSPISISRLLELADKVASITG